MRKSDVAPIQLLRIAAALWIGYLIARAITDRIILRGPSFVPLYYALNGLYALCFLGMAYWAWAQRMLRKAFLPLMMLLAVVPPTATTHLILPSLVRGPTLMVEGMMMRVLPILFVGLVLTVWQYGWKAVLLFCTGNALLNLSFPLLFARANSRQFEASFLATMIQTISFLTIGYFISQLMSRLQSQQKSLSEANTRLAHYASTLEQLTISRERNRIARELHDTLAHTLSGLSVQLETVKAYWSVDLAAAFTMLEKSLGATRHGLEETRRALKALRATPLDDLGLALAITEMAHEAAVRGNLALDLALPAHLVPLSSEIEHCIYRVAQEAVTNVLHHANAKHLCVHLQQINGCLMLKVRDDGQGFKRAERPDHFGLTGMQERANLVGGILTIDSQPGLGTTISLAIQERT